jgi:hypothetical protein
MAALTAARHNAVLRGLYERKIKEGKPFKVAIVCVMRKLFAHIDRVAAKALEKTRPPAAQAL